MDGIAWTDLDGDEQRTLRMLAENVSVESCDLVALLTLTRLGLIRFSKLTPAGEALLAGAARKSAAA
jgi:hypothetical protein